MIKHRSVTNKPSKDTLLCSVQDKVLWLALQMIYHANKVRGNPDGIKVGGHQASSASVVTILTSLFFEYMKPGDRIAVKPHASPIMHAIHYLMGNLEQNYLETLREFHGLQSYPSRTKDPDPVDFSTGSVGLGAIAPNFAALTEKYVIGKEWSNTTPAHRYIALVGDAELDEGSIWETIVEPHLRELPNIMWIIDLNRQSLDRVIPGIRVQLWRDMFKANGWHVVDAKYGEKLEEAFGLPHGEVLRQCIDDLSNEAYHRLLRLPQEEVRNLLPDFSHHPKELKKLISHWDDSELRKNLQNLGGHDFTTLRRAFLEAGDANKPSVVFAYTLKGWQLPIVGDPQNHSVILSDEDMLAVRQQLNIGQDETWSGFTAGSDEEQFCHDIGDTLRRPLLQQTSPPEVPVPATLALAYKGNMSTQQAFGLILTDILRELPEIAQRIVTMSPDVATSTNLGGWINRVGVWNKTTQEPLPQDNTQRSLKWDESPDGQHIELGISENNLFMLLSQFGLSNEMLGELVFPIGTLYDPFVCRALEAFMYGPYTGSCFMVTGTPSGITLNREGGAHQSVITPSIGIEVPGVTYYEPCFAQELQWIVLHALEQIRRRSQSFYLRLTTKRIDQTIFDVPATPEAMEKLRKQVIAGSYKLVDYSSEPAYSPRDNVVNIFTSGAMIPEALEATRALKNEGVYANVINVTSPDLLFRDYKNWSSQTMTGTVSSPNCLEHLLTGDEQKSPIVTVLDGHPHTLAWLGSVSGVKTIPLGVSQFGQTGSLQELYQEYQIDVDSIMMASYSALESNSK